MAVQPVDRELCVGCGACVLACPMDVLRMEEGKAVVRYPRECMCCAACEDECPRQAIYVTPEKWEELMVSWR